MSDCLIFVPGEPNFGGGGTGGGDVTGPASATPNALAVYNGSTGKIIKDSTITVDPAMAATNIVTFGSNDYSLETSFPQPGGGSSGGLNIVSGTLGNKFTAAAVSGGGVVDGIILIKDATPLSSGSQMIVAEDYNGTAVFMVDSAGNVNLASGATYKIDNINVITSDLWLHGVVARPVGGTNPLPVNLTTPKFTLGAAANNISYYWQGNRINVTTDKTVILNDGTGATTTSGVLVVGQHYKITTFVAGDNFSNIATVLEGTINTTGCVFTATGTTPTTWTNGSSVQRVGMPGLYWIYFNQDTGNILQGGFPGVTLNSNPLIANVVFNGTDYGLVRDERHNSTRNPDWHEWAHDTIGARYQSGITLTHNSGTGAAATFAVTLGSIHDEDIDFVINAQTTARIWWQTSATTYTFNKTLSAIPGYLGANNRPNVVRVSDYTVQQLPSATNRYVNVFVYATNDLTGSIYIFTETVSAATVTAGGYTSLANARAIPFPNLANLGIGPELKPIYRLIWRADGVLQAIDTTADDYRTVTSIPQGAGTVSTTAAAVSFVPTGNIAAGNVQDALVELDTEKVTGPASSTADGIARYSGTGGNILKNSTTFSISDTNLLNVSGQSAIFVLNNLGNIEISSGSFSPFVVQGTADTSGDAAYITINANSQPRIVIGKQYTNFNKYNSSSPLFVIDRRTGKDYIQYMGANVAADKVLKATDVNGTLDYSLMTVSSAGTVNIPTGQTYNINGVAIGGGITWTNVTGTSQAAAVNNYYIANNAALCTVTLPSTAAVGSVIKVAGAGAGGWKVAQNAGQTINFGAVATTAGTGGSLASTNQFDAVELLCVTANTTWTVISANGNVTIV